MHVYFIGIGGSGLYPLALFAGDCGFDISGSDAAQSPVTDQLEVRGATVGYAQDGSHISSVHERSPIDWVVASSAIPPDSPDIAFAREHGIRISKRDEFIAWITSEKDLGMVAITGTHGKTSTTAMGVWALEQLDVPVSYVVGAGLPFGPPGRFREDSRVFLYEADEYDRNFLYFSPEYSIITTFDYDHPDTYPSESDYRRAFRQFIRQSRLLFTWEDIADALGVATRENVRSLGSIDNRIKLPGEHSRRNASLALTALRHIVPGANEQELVDAINDFPGASRRMERLAEGIYSDYAHHPVEIAAVIQAARETYSDIVVVYQPHQNLRQHHVKDQYEHAFDGASQVYWLPTYLSREDPHVEVLSQQELMSYVGGSVHVEAADMDDSLSETIKRRAQNGDTIVLMGAGSIDAWARQCFKNVLS